jgi:hypothetical protein
LEYFILLAYDYPEDAPHVITELCRDELLDIWIKLERDTISVGVDHILSDELAYESRYKDANDVDSVRVSSLLKGKCRLRRVIKKNFSINVKNV